MGLVVRPIQTRREPSVAARSPGKKIGKPVHVREAPVDINSVDDRNTARHQDRVDTTMLMTLLAWMFGISISCMVLGAAIDQGCAAGLETAKPRGR